MTLDGDVEFKPDAVRLLVDRLKKNKKVGAACGRIHPIGSGTFNHNKQKGFKIMTYRFVDNAQSILHYAVR